MRTYSTPQSAHNLEITKLAIVECVLAVLLYVGAGIYFGTFRYLAIAVVFAPLMLFRTEVSAVWGLHVYSKLLRTIDSFPTWLFVPVAMFFTAPLGVATRIIATVLWTIRRPLYTLQETPHNWLRQTICTDFAHVPEIVPLDAVRGEEFSLPTFAIYVRNLRYDHYAGSVVYVTLLLPFVLVGWVPSLLYRISFKATCLVYAPLIWVTHLTLKNPLPLKARLERITKGELEKVRRGLSYIILGVVVVKLAFIFSWVELSYFESWFPSRRIATSFVTVDRWPWWQLTLIAEALLTFTMFFFADAAITRIENEHTWSESVVSNTVNSASFLRAVLGVVTISYLFYIALLAAFPGFVDRLQSLS